MPVTDPNTLLTPLMRGVLQRMARAQRTPMHAMTPVQARATYAAGAGVLDVPLQPLARDERLHMATRDGAQLPAQLLAPSHDALPVLLYFHGGGFTVGSVATHESLCRQLAHLAQCAVVSVDYRLAPEHPFPTAANDAWDSLAWLHQHAAALGLDATRLAVGGDSAGGTLAAVCAIQARDAGVPLALQLLLYPGCTAHQDTASHRRFAQGFLLDAALIDYFFGQYVRSPSDRDDWRFAPLNAPDVEGVAPAWIGLAECDPLVDEGVDYADKLRASGVAVDLEIYRGVVHEFIKMGRAIPEAQQAQRDAADALRRAWG